MRKAIFLVCVILCLCLAQEYDLNYDDETATLDENIFENEEAETLGVPRLMTSTECRQLKGSFIYSCMGNDAYIIRIPTTTVLCGSTPAMGKCASQPTNGDTLMRLYVTNNTYLVRQEPCPISGYQTSLGLCWTRGFDITCPSTFSNVNGVCSTPVTYACLHPSVKVSSSKCLLNGVISNITPTCPSNTNFNATSKKCELSYCPRANMIYDARTRSCEGPPSCDNSSYNTRCTIYTTPFTYFE